MREVIDFCTEQPEIRSWLDYFDDPTEEEALAAVSGELEGGHGAPFGGVGGVEDTDIVRQVKSGTAAKSIGTGEKSCCSLHTGAQQGCGTKNSATDGGARQNVHLP